MGPLALSGAAKFKSSVRRAVAFSFWSLSYQVFVLKVSQEVIAPALILFILNCSLEKLFVGLVIGVLE